ncbi:MAG TPA: rhomboid family intramembrane serine protease [Vicinamibacterales bacterium]|nr:rhomboid family intramembrane serine protease [Vicinamibacterales bacterium]
MFRQKTGSVVCASCGSLVGVKDDKCYNCGRRNPGLWGFGPVLRRFGNEFGFTTVIVYGCCGLYALSLILTVLSGGNLFSGSFLSLLGPNRFAYEALGAAGAYPVFGEGHWWTVLSAGWLHGGALHILFNLMGVRQLGPAVEDLYGGARMVIIYTISSATGFLLSSFLGAHAAIPFFSGGFYTLGASAPIFGLLGALVYYGRRGGSSLVRSQAMSYVVTMAVFGFIMPGIDNAAHLGGFVGGYLAGMWLDPLKRERMDHFIGAAICLVVTAMAIAASLMITLPYLPAVMRG